MGTILLMLQPAYKYLSTYIMPQRNCLELLLYGRVHEREKGLFPLSLQMSLKHAPDREHLQMNFSSFEHLRNQHCIDCVRNNQGDK